jgi:hypothetical protein
MSITVTKADGSREPFHTDKLRRSLKRAGATEEEISDIVRQTESVLHDGISTQEIYRLAFEMLRQSETPIRARYSLRRALFGLGPTGFPFEDFLARLFQAEGYTTQTRVILQGHCAEHELDVAAYKSDHSFVAEAKFHSSPGVKTDLQVVLYSFARLHDLKEARICNADICGIRELMVVTNTKFTTTAEKYAACSGLTLLSWDYPEHDNLHDRIQRAKLYPVSVLQSLSASQKRALIDRGVIVCNDIIEKPHLLRHAHISPKRIEQVQAEAKALTEGDFFDKQQ